MKQKTLKMSDGSTIVGTIVAKAAHILVVKVKTIFYLVNKAEIVSEGNVATTDDENDE